MKIERTKMEEEKKMVVKEKFQYFSRKKIMFYLDEEKIETLGNMEFCLWHGQECCVFISDDVIIRGIFSLTHGTAKLKQLDESCS